MPVAATVLENNRGVLETSQRKALSEQPNLRTVAVSYSLHLQHLSSFGQFVKSPKDGFKKLKHL
jgi:hypothetical protein